MIGERHASRAAVMVLAVAAALSAQPNGHGAARVALALVAALALLGRLADPVERQAGEVGALALMSLGGVYACVPETSHIVPLGAAAVAAVALAEFVFPSTWRTTFSASCVLIVILMVFTGGVYRHGSLVGGWATLGLLIVEPVVAPVAARKVRRWVKQDRWKPALRVVIQAGCALGVARTSGLNGSVAVSSVLAASWLLGVALAAMAINGGLE